MKKARAKDMRPEYRRDELGDGVRGKHHDAYQAGTNLILLNPDVAKAFPTDASVNEALRTIIRIARQTLAEKKPTRTGRARTNR